MKMRAVNAPWYRGVQFVLRDGNTVVKEVVFEEVSSESIVDPSFTLGMEEAQVLIDDLWNAGLRPTEGTGSAGSLRATEKHLADMRLIAFSQLDLKG